MLASGDNPRNENEDDPIVSDEIWEEVSRVRSTKEIWSILTKNVGTLTKVDKELVTEEIIKRSIDFFISHPLLEAQTADELENSGYQIFGFADAELIDAIPILNRCLKKSRDVKLIAVPEAKHTYDIYFKLLH